MRKNVHDENTMDDWEWHDEDNNDWEDVCMNCMTPDAWEQCCCCGGPLCHKCFECGGGFCDECLDIPDFDKKMGEHWE